MFPFYLPENITKPFYLPENITKPFRFLMFSEGSKGNIGKKRVKGQQLAKFSKKILS